MDGWKRRSEPAEGGQWVEIRDEEGRLYARLDVGALVLEVGRNGGWVQVKLDVYIVGIGETVDLREDIG